MGREITRDESPVRALKKWIHRYLSLQTLEREDLGIIFGRLSDMEAELSELRALVTSDSSESQSPSAPDS